MNKKLLMPAIAMYFIMLLSCISVFIWYRQLYVDYRAVSLLISIITFCVLLVMAVIMILILVNQAIEEYNNNLKEGKG